MQGSFDRKFFGALIVVSAAVAWVLWSAFKPPEPVIAPMTADETRRVSNEKPRDAIAYCDRVIAWIAKKNPDQALADFTEAGQFGKAVEWQQKAIELTPEERKADFRTRLTLYENKQPFRVAPRQ